MNNDIDVRPLEKLLTTYEYGKHHLKFEDIEVIYNPKSDSILIKNFYAFGKFLRVGNCVELMNTSCMESKIICPELYVYRAIGHEPRFFFQGKINHYFNIVSEVKLMEANVSYIDNKKEIQKLLKKYDPWIEDASFKYIKRFSGSKYIIDAICNEGICQKNNNTVTIAGPENMKPIGLTSDSKAIYISMSPKFHETFLITIQDINREIPDKVMPIQDKRLNDIIKSENVLKTIDIFRNKEKKVSVQPIDSREEVFYG